MTQTFLHPERGCVPQGATEMTQTNPSIRCATCEASLSSPLTVRKLEGYPCCPDCGAVTSVRPVNPSIRQLAEETLEELHSVQLRHEASSFYDDAIQTIESALTTLATGYEQEADRLMLENAELRKLATQIREEDARMVESAGSQYEPGDHLRAIAAAIRARQEK